MSFQLASKHVVITGASSGIGEATAREFARAGAMVTVIARRVERLEALAREFANRNAPFKVLPYDLSLAGAGRIIGNYLATREPAVDVLVNNAGTSGEVCPFSEKSDSTLDSTFQLNLLTPVQLTRALLPGMIKRRAGIIVNLSSMMAWVPAPCSSVYTATKRALAAFDEVLRVELKGSSVSVISVFPGPIDTDLMRHTLRMQRGALFRIMPLGDVNEMARRIRIGVEKRRRFVIYPGYIRPLRFATPIIERLLAAVEPFIDWQSED